MRKPTTGNLGPRDHGPHGVTVAMKAIKRPAPEYLHRFEAVPSKRSPGAMERVGQWLPIRSTKRDAA